MPKVAKNKETKYLLDTVNDIQYNKNRFTISLDEDKYLFGIVSGNNSSTPYSKLMQYKTLYNTLMDLDYKIKVSFIKAIEYAYSNSLQEDFTMFQESPTEEIYAYYFIENALFRTSSLWDILAQLYRLYYNIIIEAENVHYKKIFNPKLDFSTSFKNQAKEINDYIYEKDDTDCQGMWKGNHTFVKKRRDKMIHRNSPNVTSLSDFDINFKQHPTYMLKRIIEDYSVVSNYIESILNMVEKDLLD